MMHMITEKGARALGVTFSTLLLRVVGMSSQALFILAGFALSTRFMT